MVVIILIASVIASHVVTLRFEDLRFDSGRWITLNPGHSLECLGFIQRKEANNILYRMECHLDSLCHWVSGGPNAVLATQGEVFS